MVIILGAGGFVGGALSLSLRSTYSVKTLRRSEASLNDPDSLRRHLEPGSVVVNAAGYADATDTSPNGVLRFQKDNVDGVRNLAEICIECGVSQLIHISSVAAMGPCIGENVSELVMLRPESPYASSKLEAENVLAGFNSVLNITILRPTSVFGPGRGLSDLLCRVAQMPIICLPGGGKAKIPFTDIENVIEGVRKCILNSNTFGRTFIVGDGGSYMLRDILKELANSLGRTQILLPIPNFMFNLLILSLNTISYIFSSRRLIDNSRWRTLTRSVSFSIDSIRIVTGFEPKVTLSESTRRIAKWYREKS
jgi:dihydroflavonol-4-reductase